MTAALGSRDPGGVLPPGRLVVRAMGLSGQIDLRTVGVCATLAVALVAAAVWSLTAGTIATQPADALRVVTGATGEGAAFVIGQLRLPRLLVGVGVGAAFGMAGTIFQSLVRNPLGSPDVVGFNAGAALGAVATIVAVGGGVGAVSLGAITGGLVTAGGVTALAWRHGIPPQRLVLVGIGAMFALTAAVDHLLTRTDVADLQQAAVWLTGSLNGRGWDQVQAVWLLLAAMVPLALLLGRDLDRLRFTDDVAATLGVAVGARRVALITVGAMLAATGVADAGPVPFVAFVAGPIARGLTGAARAHLVTAGLVGALVTVVADVVARVAFAPAELPVGVVTAVLGAPYLAWLLARQRHGGVI